MSFILRERIFPNVGFWASSRHFKLKTALPNLFKECKINIRQQKYKRNRIDGMSKKAAALAAGYSINTAINAGENLEKRCHIADFLEAEGLTDKALSDHAKQGLNANKVIGYLHSYKKDDVGDIKKIEPEEVVSNEFVEVPDWGARHKYYETILKLLKKIEDKPLVDNSTHYVFFNDIVKKSRELVPAAR
jgi:hypothetical protein